MTTLDPAATAAAQDTLDHVVEFMSAVADLYEGAHDDVRLDAIVARLELDADDVRDFPRMRGEMAEQAIASSTADVDVYRLCAGRVPDESCMIVDLLWEYGGPTTVVRAEVDSNGEVERVEVRTSRHLDEGVSASPMGRAATTHRDALHAVGVCVSLLGVSGVEG